MPFTNGFKNYRLSAMDNVSKWKMKKLIELLEPVRGNGNCLVSIAIPPQGDISSFSGMLDREIHTISNSQKSIPSALRSLEFAQKLLSKHSERPLPRNGLVLYAGLFPYDDGKEEGEASVVIAPFKPLDVPVFFCEDRFHTEILTQLVECRDRTVGYIIVDYDGVLLGRVTDTNEVLREIRGCFPEKERISIDELFDYLKPVVKELFTDPVTGKGKVSGIILAGTSILPEVCTGYDPTFAAMELFNLLGIDFVLPAHVSEGWLVGWVEAIQQLSCYIHWTRYLVEKVLLANYFKELSLDPGNAFYGLNDTLKFLDQGCVEILILAGSLDVNIYMLRSSMEVIEVFLRKEYEEDFFSRNRDFILVKKVSVLDYFASICLSEGIFLEVVSDSHGFFNIGGITKYPRFYSSSSESDDDAYDSESYGSGCESDDDAYGSESYGSGYESDDASSAETDVSEAGLSEKVSDASLQSSSLVTDCGGSSFDKVDMRIAKSEAASQSGQAMFSNAGNSSKTGDLDAAFGSADAALGNGTVTHDIPSEEGILRLGSEMVGDGCSDVCNMEVDSSLGDHINVSHAGLSGKVSDASLQSSSLITAGEIHDSSARDQVGSYVARENPGSSGAALNAFQESCFVKEDKSDVSASSFECLNRSSLSSEEQTDFIAEMDIRLSEDVVPLPEECAQKDTGLPALLIGQEEKIEGSAEKGATCSLEPLEEPKDSEALTVVEMDSSQVCGTSQVNIPSEGMDPPSSSLVTGQGMAEDISGKGGFCSSKEEPEVSGSQILGIILQTNVKGNLDHPLSSSVTEEANDNSSSTGLLDSPVLVAKEKESDAEIGWGSNFLGESKDFDAEIVVVPSSSAAVKEGKIECSYESGQVNRSMVSGETTWEASEADVLPLSSLTKEQQNIEASLAPPLESKVFEAEIGDLLDASKVGGIVVELAENANSEYLGLPSSSIEAERKQEDHSSKGSIGSLVMEGSETPVFEKGSPINASDPCEIVTELVSQNMDLPLVTSTMGEP